MDKDLLQDIDELLRYLEDYEHGETGKKITEMRGRLQPLIYAKEDLLETFVDNWIKLWPTPHQMVSYGFPDKKALVDRKAIMARMKAFIKDLKGAEKEQMIYNATKDYIKDIRDKGKWQYIKKAHYFIEKKGDGSDLRAYIEVALLKPTDVVTNKTNQDFKFS